MPIEKCPKCEDQVLDSKYSCPGCGYVKRDEPEQQKHPKHEITTKNTSKHLQIQGVIALFLLIAGLLWFYLTADAYEARDQLNVVALLMFVVGFFWYAVVRFRIWHQHDDRDPRD
ncbi:zinc ribbon domain-containing protein [Pseudidiomarina sp. 1APP75-27a]|uniref:zinc ribbon domain-containing protein n=1 Tax=Pseudidiomarina terrestris TaxID=2820060 RepID=UPI002B055924|nr:zinc ribbon domain-containing protein [Pseudidiomarina sp. 1APP75-27a]MEA3588515.1 zinc ribbon domain-containing protein [Pseudidiomarina sp. 1APP75-27a]